jgi:apolipoprotein N-acyltransferase
MAKENKRTAAAKGGYEVNPWLLFFIATALLVTSWLMKSFPILIFVALSPLFALADKIHSEDKFWNYAELILIALALSLLAGHIFQLQYLIVSMIQAIGFTLAFVGYGFVHQSLGPRAGKITIIILWLAIEYIFLKLQWPADSLFLADAIQLKTDWLNWTFHTGYLGSSLWILLANLILYLAVFKSGRINWIWLILFLGLLAAPILFSFTSELSGINREEMITLYSNTLGDLKTVYLKRGEFIPRTAAWISVLIFIFALVKNKTQKK